MSLKFGTIKEEHLEQVRAWRMSDDVSKYMYTDPLITPEDQVKWYRRVAQDASRMDWIVEFDRRGIGVVSLYNIDTLNRKCSWAYYLGESTTRGQGVGKSIELNVLRYVFEELRLHKLCCEVFEWNNLVVEIHQKYGSKVEGLLRDHIFKGGTYHSVVRMGILRQDWKKGVRGKFDYMDAEIEEWDDKKRHILQ